jgi:hypothetical protein
MLSVYGFIYNQSEINGNELTRRYSYGVFLREGWLTTSQISSLTCCMEYVFMYLFTENWLLWNVLCLKEKSHGVKLVLYNGYLNYVGQLRKGISQFLLPYQYVSILIEIK